MSCGACTQVRLWHARDVANKAGEGAEAPSKGLSRTCRVWPLSSVPLSPPSSTESGSGSPAATGISGAVVAEWPRAAGCRPGPYAWVSATGLGDSAATPLSAGSAKETRLELRAAILREFSTPRPGGRTAKCESVWSGHKVCGVVNHKLCGVYAKPCGVKSVWGGKAQSVWGQIKCVGW